MSLDAEQWQRVNEIFDHIVDKSPSHRADYLDMVCEGSDAIRSEVERLLAASDAIDEEGSIAESFLKAATGPPDSVGAYALDDLLGQGGMGEVYAATHPQHGDVALKLLPKFFVQEPTARQRFENEARILKELEHPSLCKLYEYFVTDDYACIAMEHVQGAELSTLLKAGPVTHRQALRIVSQLASVLAAAHAAGITHRDVKPGNVIVTGDDLAHVKLLDFGIAKFADLKLTATGQAIGSPRYMSPEQWRGEPVDQRTDLWSLGVLWHEMLAGERPFDGNEMMDVVAAVLTAAPAELPSRSVDGVRLAAVAEVIARLLAKDPAKRVSSCAELLDDLALFGSSI